MTTLFKTLLAVAVVLAFVGCSSSGGAGDDDVAHVRRLLLARHAKDLPGRAVLDRHPGAPAALAEIARRDRRIVVRARALQLLGLYPTPATAELLTSVVADRAAPAKLRAAAVFGLSRFDLGAAPAVRATVVGALRDRDLPVAAAAIAALRDVPAAAPELVRASTDPALSPAARQRVSQVLAGH